MKARSAKGGSQAEPPSRHRPSRRPSARPEPPLEEEAFLHQAREVIARIEPELRHLERLRDHLSARLQAKAGDARAPTDETGRILTRLLEILRHGISGLEEGWVELDDSFSKKGVLRLERRAARERKDP